MMKDAQLMGDTAMKEVGKQRPFDSGSGRRAAVETADFQLEHTGRV